MARNTSTDEISQWVSQVIAFSTQYNNIGWAATQIVGEPRVYPRYGDHTGAWAQGNCFNNEYIELEFPQRIFVSSLHIYETLNCGAVTCIKLKHPSGQWRTVYTAQAQHNPSSSTSRIFQPQIETTDFQTNQVRIEQDCTVAGSWCEIDAVKMTGFQFKLPSPPPLTNLAEDFGRLVDCPDFSDVTIRVGGRNFFAHRVILAARSTYFRSLLSDRWKESTSKTVDIEKISENAFTGVLQYIYTNDIDTQVTDTSLIELMRVADRFSLDGLEKICAVYLHSRINASNVISIYLEASSKLPVLDDLRDDCMRYITEHLSTVSKCDDFARLPQNIMLEIIQSSAARLSLD